MCHAVSDSQSRVCTGTHFHIPAGTVTPAEGHYGVPTLTAQNYSVGWAHDGAWKLLRELGPGLFSRAAVWWTYPLTGIAELSEGEWDFAGMTSYLKDFHAAIDGQDRVVGPAISSVRESDAFSICRAVHLANPQSLTVQIPPWMFNGSGNCGSPAARLHAHRWQPWSEAFGSCINLENAFKLRDPSCSEVADYFARKHHPCQTPD